MCVCIYLCVYVPQHILESRESFRTVWANQLKHHPAVAAPPSAYGALSAHILDRDVRSSAPGGLRVLFALDLAAVKQLDGILADLVMTAHQVCKKGILLFIK